MARVVSWQSCTYRPASDFPEGRPLGLPALMPRLSGVLPLLKPRPIGTLCGRRWNTPVLPPPMAARQHRFGRHDSARRDRLLAIQCCQHGAGSRPGGQGMWHAARSCMQAGSCCAAAAAARQATGVAMAAIKAGSTTVRSDRPFGSPKPPQARQARAATRSGLPIAGQTGLSASTGHSAAVLSGGSESARRHCHWRSDRRRWVRRPWLRLRLRATVRRRWGPRARPVGHRPAPPHQSVPTTRIHAA